MSKKNNGFSYKDGVSLKEYFEAKFDSLKLSTDLVRQALEKRLEGMNEFREALKDQTNKFITRVEFQLVCEKVEEIKDEINKRPTWMITGVVSILIALVVYLLTHNG